MDFKIIESYSGKSMLDLKDYKFDGKLRQNIICHEGYENIKKSVFLYLFVNMCRGWLKDEPMNLQKYGTFLTKLLTKLFLYYSDIRIMWEKYCFTVSLPFS